MAAVQKLQLNFNKKVRKIEVELKFVVYHFLR